MTIKKAGIYDRWLSTLGGGEQVAFAYAQTLSELGYKVDLITFKQVDIKKAEKKMGVSLKNINIRYLHESANNQISSISEEYELFINTSHLDYFPNRSKNGQLSVFFPGLLKLTPIEYLKRAFFIPSFRKLFIYPSRYEGFKFDQHLNGKIYKWLSKESSIVFKDNVNRFQIDLFLREFTFSVLDKITFTIDGDELIPISKKIKEKENIVTYYFDNMNTLNKKFTIHLPNNEYSENIALLSLTIPNMRFALYNLFKKIFPVWEMRLHGGPGITKKSDLLSYNKIITISEFCKKWIKKYWGLNSTVLYPPVNTDNFHSSKNKKNIILHVGRFFITGHSKKQLDLVKVFKQIINKHNIKNWELHFVGSVEEGENHKRYYEKVVSESSGYPVIFHKNISFIQLKKLFSESKIYWHATGLGENEHKNPVALEHFGITTVEAMASGAVPVVINMGGQKEIVTKSSGFKWDTREELISHTVKLINDKTLLNKLSKSAITRSNFFSKSNFKKKFKEIVQNDK